MLFNRKCFIFSMMTLFIIGFSQPSFASSQGGDQKGKASWYGSKYHGRKTSSGERFNKNDMTAAHKTLPFGTKVKVTNLLNNESVIVRINDRGPFVGNRIIDVSEAAARKLEMRAQGTGHVKIEVLNTPSKIASASGFKFELPDFADHTSVFDTAPAHLVLSNN